MLIFCPGDLESIPLAGLHSLTWPGIPSEALWLPWYAAHACLPRYDQNVNICPSSGSRPMLHACSVAARSKGDSNESSNMGLRNAVEAQSLGLDDENSSRG